jgi:ribonucleoside-diphosphate reductase alpha chain
MEKLNKWYPIYLNMLLSFKICPNTPTWASAAIPGFGSFACSVVGNGDSMEEISKWYTSVLYMNKYGFGIGHSLHKFRPAGAPFAGSKTTTKSPLKWLNAIQEMSVGMSQGDSGRGGANLVSMPIWHPSILEFIGYKNHPENMDIEFKPLMKSVMNSDLDIAKKEALINILDKSVPLRNFNMSVLVNDDFMRAVEEDKDWVLKFELPDHAWKQEITVKASELWDKIVTNAFQTGDPGLLFFNRINKDNHLMNIKGPIWATNPCGEQALGEWEICNLWTINLMKHINFYHGNISWAQLRDSINVAVRMADNLVTQNEYPAEVPELERNEKDQRRIGIDYTGLADAMYVLGITYGSKESYTLVNELYKFQRDNTRTYSAILGKKKGSFPLLRHTDLYNHGSEHYDKCPKCESKLIHHEDNEYYECTKCSWSIYRYLRNLELTTQAPTGTRSRMLGVSFGLEPQFGKWYKSKVMEGKEVYNVNHVLDWYVRNHSINIKKTREEVIKMIDDGAEFPFLEPWIEAYDLKPEQHIEIQSIAQTWVSNAVSKTINFDEKTTKEDLNKAYFLAWKKGLKGITIYRKGSQYNEVISGNDVCPSCESEDLLAVEGCVQCKACGWAKCSV